jgi:DNA (cytosine-5)-methyltransferase 1
VSKPAVVDFGCKAGGMSMGLHRAGWDVVGVDIEPQAHYPFPFVRGDFLELASDVAFMAQFDAAHGSPPCQAFTNARVIHGRHHEDLLTPLRALLQAWGGPWVIENVPGAPMRRDVTLCGSMFGEPRLRRHRWFEFSTPPTDLLLLPPCNHSRETVSVFGHGGHRYHGVEEWREVMGIDWMTRDELAQAIPPAYGELIGKLLLLAVVQRNAA